MNAYDIVVHQQVEELLERMTVALLRRGKQPAAGGLPRGRSGEEGI